MFRHPLTTDSDLRLLERHHAPKLFAAADRNREYLREWLPWLDQTKEVSDSEAFIAHTQKQWGENDGFQCAIWKGDEIIGMIGFHGVNWSQKSASLGYWLSAEHQGKGIVTAACRAMLNHAFLEWKLARVEIRCATGNVKSQAIPERLGFTREGVARKNEFLYGKFVDHVVYGMTDDDWSRVSRRL